MHARAAIRLAALAVYGADRLHQPLVFFAAPALRPLAPGVKAARAHSVQRAHHSDRERFPVRVDELEDFALRAEVNAMAFFRISCSSFSRSYCFFTRRSSLSSAAVSFPISTPFVTIRPSRASLRQRDSMKG